MLVFRSEDHLERWLAGPDRPEGATMTLAQQWELAGKWFAGRHTPAWRRRSPDEAQAVLHSVGLTSDFWSF